MKKCDLCGKEQSDLLNTTGAGCWPIDVNHICSNCFNNATKAIDNHYKKKFEKFKEFLIKKTEITNG